MELFGTITSPYVRRVRIVANILGLDYKLINTADEDGQKKLRETSPLWKVPTLVHGDTILWDSHTIIDWMFEKYGFGSIKQIATDHKWHSVNIISACDAVLDSGINVFYLKKDNVDIESVPYLKKQMSRIEALLAWLTKQLNDQCLNQADGFSYADIALVTTIDWLDFRKACNLDDSQVLLDYASKMNKIKSIGETYPA